MKCKDLGTYSRLGQKHFGLDKAPDLIRENGFINILKNSSCQYANLRNIKLSNTNDFWHLLNHVKQKFLKMSAQRNFFNLGGDHNITIGTIEETLENFRYRLSLDRRKWRSKYPNIVYS